MRITTALASAGAAALAATTFFVTTDTATANTARAAQSRQIASATVGTDLTATVTVTRSGDTDADAYITFSSNGSKTSERVPGDWFWSPLTGKNAVCEFGIDNRPGAKPVVDLSLLITPSIGCSETAHFTVE
jgi:hypothetical protein